MLTDVEGKEGRSVAAGKRRRRGRTDVKASRSSRSAVKTRKMTRRSLLPERAGAADELAMLGSMREEFSRCKACGEGRGRARSGGRAGVARADGQI
jgi:hypothetical protein